MAVSTRDHPNRGIDWTMCGAVTLLSLIPALPLLLGPGLISTRASGDSPFLLLRVHQLARNLADGVFPARWMPNAAYGLGYPAFNLPRRWVSSWPALR